MKIGKVVDATDDSRPTEVENATLYTTQPDEGDTDPFRLARAFLDGEGRDEQRRIAIRFWRDQWFMYRKGRYVSAEESAMRVSITGFAKKYFDENGCVDSFGVKRRVTKALVGNVLNALTALVAVPADVEMPAWLGDDEQGPFLALQNGLIDISKLPDGPVCVLESTPLWFSTTAFPVEFREGATCERWVAFLREVMEDDDERMELLQEWVGYLLTADTTQHKFVVAEGEGANGKSVCFDVIGALLGPDNVSHVPLEMFGVRFQLTATLQKLANICAEVGEIDKVAEGYLKQFTAGDRMYFDRKNISGVMAYPTARLMLSSNNRPRFRDRSGGLWRRMIVVPFRVTIEPGRQDPLLKEKLKEELPGILQWALEGLKRLRRRECFNVPAVCQQTLDDYQQESNPARVFLVEMCHSEPGASTMCSYLYQEYEVWSRDNGFEVLDARQFGKEVRRVYSTVERRRTSGHQRPWAYRGLSYGPRRPMRLSPLSFEEEIVGA